MQLYNTLTRSLMKLRPIRPGEISLYTCGPTVYAYAHIGNLRKFIFDDTLRRTLEAAGYHVNHVMNITDVGHLVSDADEGDDKLESGAKREGKTVWEVATAYTEAFTADMQRVNVLPPSDGYAKATDYIEQQIDIVRLLIERGHAYRTEQAIYFDVTSSPDYGELSGQRLSDKEVGARSEVVTDPNKRHPSDFAVWFFTVGHFAGHSMRWTTPWGEGFPGWHLECSAIIHATLGDPIDIHTGGVDHIGTHHPNEMAQTQAAFGHHLANIWVHSEFVLVDGAKMSKSKHNSYILSDITGRGFDPMALRLLVLQAHYRSELNFTWDSLEAARNALLNLCAWADLSHQPELLPQLSAFDADRATVAIQTSLEDDLDTPAALAKLFELAGNDVTAKQLDTALIQLDRLLGLKLSGRADITAFEKALVSDRETARTAKDWLAADHLRRQLADHDLVVDDTPAGPRWRRTATTAEQQ